MDLIQHYCGAARWDIIAASTLSWWLLAQSLKVLSPYMFGKSYSSFESTVKRIWNIRAVALIHSVLIVILAFPIIFDPVVTNNRVFAYSQYASLVFSISCGYFLWDFYICIKDFHYYGMGGLLHAVFCFFVYLFVQRPFLTYYGAVFLLFELSTPFLNLNWFFAKSGKVGSRLQKANGMILLFLFFAVRIVFGIYSSIQFGFSLYEEFHRSPLFLVAYYGTANIALNLLNIFWFFLMLRQWKVAMKKAA